MAFWELFQGSRTQGVSYDDPLEDFLSCIEELKVNPLSLDFLDAADHLEICFVFWVHKEVVVSSGSCLEVQLELFLQFFHNIIGIGEIFGREYLDCWFFSGGQSGSFHDGVLANRSRGIADGGVFLLVYFPNSVSFLV